MESVGGHVPTADQLRLKISDFIFSFHSLWGEFCLVFRVSLPCEWRKMSPCENNRFQAIKSEPLPLNWTSDVNFYQNI